MVCDPNEHNFVKQTSYSVELETDSAVVKEGTEEKRCTECGKTPEELGDFVSSDATADETNETEVTAQQNPNGVETEDDAVIMGADNSESQSASQQDAARSTTHGNEVDDDEVLHQGDQTDDAYILDSGNSEIMDEPPEEPTVPTGPMLGCENCGFECPESDTPHYPGDSCPECQKDYLQKQ